MLERKEKKINVCQLHNIASGKSAALLISNPAPSDRASFIHFPSAYSGSLDPPNVIITFPAPIVK